MAGENRLDICRCGIDDTYAQLIFKSLKSNKTLEKLDIAYNEIGSNGLKALAEALVENKSLVHLNMEANPLIEEETE